MSGVCSGQSSARTRGRRAGLWSPRRCAVTLGCVVIVGAHGHRRRHVVTGASPWSRGARGHRQGSGHRGGVWWSRGPRSSPIAYHLSIRMSIIYHLSIHPSSTHHPSINAGKSFCFWAKGLRFALSIDENVPPPGTSVAASLAAEAAGQLPLLTAPAAHASQGRDAAGGRSRDWVPDARGACRVQPALCSSHPETPALLSRAAASWALIASCGFHVAPHYVCGKSCICEEAWGTHTHTLSRAPVLVGCGAPGTAGRA